MKLTKYFCHVFADQRYVLDNEIYTLAYFYKNSVTSCKEVKKECNKKEDIKEDCNKGIKKILLIQKDCDKKDCDN